MNELDYLENLFSSQYNLIPPQFRSQQGTKKMLERLATRN